MPPVYRILVETTVEARDPFEAQQKVREAMQRAEQNEPITADTLPDIMNEYGDIVAAG
jgi:transcriptional regulator NrdR family protein